MSANSKPSPGFPTLDDIRTAVWLEHNVRKVGGWLLVDTDGLPYIRWYRDSPRIALLRKLCEKNQHAITWLLEARAH